MCKEDVHLAIKAESGGNAAVARAAELQLGLGRFGAHNQIWFPLYILIGRVNACFLRLV